MGYDILDVDTDVEKDKGLLWQQWILYKINWQTEQFQTEQSF